MENEEDIYQKDDDLEMDLTELEYELDNTNMEDDDIEIIEPDEEFTKTQRMIIEDMNIKSLDKHVEPKITRLVRILNRIQKDNKEKDNQLIAKQDEQDDKISEGIDIAKRAMKKSTIKSLFSTKAGIFSWAYAFSCMVLIGLIIGAGDTRWTDTAYIFFVVGMAYALLSGLFVLTVPMYVISLKFKNYLNAKEIQQEIDNQKERIAKLTEDSKSLKLREELAIEKAKNIRQAEQLLGIGDIYDQSLSDDDIDEEDDNPPVVPKKVKPKILKKKEA